MHALKHLFYDRKVPFVVEVFFVSGRDSEALDVDLLFDHFMWCKVQGGNDMCCKVGEVIINVKIDNFYIK